MKHRRDQSEISTSEQILVSIAFVFNSFQLELIFTALHEMQMRLAMRILSVCLSVCHTCVL